MTFNTFSKDSYNDATITLGNKNISLEFTHIPTGMKCKFKAFLESYSENYESNWNHEYVYGRMDPLSTFNGTSRKITMSWALPAAGLKEAKANHREVSKFLMMLYPSYEERFLLDDEGKQTDKFLGMSDIAAAPLLRMKLANWAARADDQGKGLLVAPTGCQFEPMIEHGTFINGGKLYPKSIILSSDFVVFHEHELGFTTRAGESGPSPARPGFGTFPFGQINERLVTGNAYKRKALDDNRTAQADKDILLGK